MEDRRRRVREKKIINLKLNPANAEDKPRINSQA